MKPSTLLLGIETSCDETAAAVVADGRRILSSVTRSQTDVHHRYGGIVPEMAAREHVRHIVGVTQEALGQAGIPLSSLAAVGVATSPGLLGALLAGISFGKALSWSIGVPLVEVNHLEGHILAATLVRPRPRFPLVALVVSGGHTSLYRVGGPTDFQLLGRTLDDAAGEAFDKVAKALGLGYPGGPVLERLAAEGDPAAVRLPRSWLGRSSLDFSFSGLKTAVLTHLRGVHRVEPAATGTTDPILPRQVLADLAASFQAAVIEVLVGKTLAAAAAAGVTTLAVTGGVAANGALRQAFKREAGGLRVHFPPPALCTDNAAMIAAAAWHRLKKGTLGSLSTDAAARGAHCCPGKGMV